MHSSSYIAALTAAILLLGSPQAAHSFTAAALPKKSSLTSSTPSSLSATSSNYQEDLTFTPPNTIIEGPISEELCTTAAQRMKRVMVPVSSEVSETGFVGISFIHFPASSKQQQQSKKKTLPLLLVHGFDSSSLEYRRLGPQLASMGIDVYAVDLLGWGYTQLDNVKSFSAAAKVEALQGFWKTVGGNGEVVVGGASLGGAAVIEFAAKNLYEEENVDDAADENNNSSEGFVRGTVLIDAQGFVDGIGPMSFLPAPLARAGIKVLQSVPLRNSANQMSYYNPDTYATEDALNVGRLHCLRDGWEDGMLSFMQSGGFRPKAKVSKINVPSLVLWGRQDGILDGEEFAQKFIDTMPNAKLQWVEECGHVPHLEQPELTARYITNFLESEEMKPKGKSGANVGVDSLFGNLFSFLN